MGCLCRHIRQDTRRLRNEFDSDVPPTVYELCSLPGIGLKMAFLRLHAGAWEYVSFLHLCWVVIRRKETWAFGLDVRVHRITNRPKRHKPPTEKLGRKISDDSVSLYTQSQVVTAQRILQRDKPPPRRLWQVSFSALPPPSAVIDVSAYLRSFDYLSTPNATC
jgi:hypothetical protein